MRGLWTLIAAALAVACLLLSNGCRPSAPADWRPVLHSVDSLVSKGDTAAAFTAVRAFVQQSSSRASRAADTSYVAVVDTFARLMSRTGDLRLAEQLYRRALNEQGPPATDTDREAHVRLLRGLGQMLTDLGQLNEAEDVLDSCHAMCREHSLQQAVVYADVLLASGHLRYAEGDFAEAESFWEQALALRQRLASADDPNVAVLWSNLGNALTALGEADSAEANYLRALRIFDHLRPDRDYEYLAVVSNLAGLYADHARLTEALDYYRRAIKIAEEHYGARHPRAADILVNIGTIDFEMGIWSDALSNLRRAESIYGDLRVPDPEAQKCEYNLGMLFYRLQEWDSAEVHAQRSLVLAQACLGEENPEVAFPSDLLSQIHLGRGEWEAARADRRTAYRLAREQFLSQYLSLSESNALIYSDQFRAQTSDYLTTLLRCQDTPTVSNREIAEVVLRSKALVQDGALARQRLLRHETDTRLAAKIDSLNLVRTHRAQLALSMENLPASPAMQRELAALRTQAVRLEKEVVTASPLHRGYVDVPVDSVYSALRRLPTGAAVVDFLAFGLRDEEDMYRSYYLGIVFSDTGLVACVLLGTADEIERPIRIYREYLSQPRTVSADQINRASRAVYEAAWRPLEPYVAKAHMVVICPDGDLNSVSFAGLPDDSGRYLIERHALQYMSTTRDFVRLIANHAPVGKGLLLVGNPDYRGQLPELKYAQRELASAAEWWKSVFAEPVEMLTGKDASEHNFRWSYAGKRVMYFAAHSTEIPAIAGSGSFPNAEVPEDLLRNGMVLADYRPPGGNPQPPDADGVLTADEISALDLDGTELAVLSLCESGGGTLISGEGVYGLRRAFQMAGVQTVVSTLWPVDDFATAELMERSLFDTTATYSENLQKICLARIADLVQHGQTPNPYAWAAFVCTGNWRR